MPHQIQFDGGPDDGMIGGINQLLETIVRRRSVRLEDGNRRVVEHVYAIARVVNSIVIRGDNLVVYRHVPQLVGVVKS